VLQIVAEEISPLKSIVLGKWEALPHNFVHRKCEEAHLRRPGHETHPEPVCTLGRGEHCQAIKEIAQQTKHYSILC